MVFVTAKGDGDGRGSHGDDGLVCGVWCGVCVV